MGGEADGIFHSFKLTETQQKITIQCEFEKFFVKNNEMSYINE